MFAQQAPSFSALDQKSTIVLNRKQVTFSKKKKNCNKNANKHKGLLGFQSSTFMVPNNASGMTGYSEIVYNRNYHKGLGVQKVVGMMFLFSVNLHPYPNLSILVYR